ncbi:MAG TPA: hypothetical protein VFQ53_31400 [Kofleriaceae bacterium]|nr:hypothetical protein [Kofleriaceae bacterium]
MYIGRQYQAKVVTSQHDRFCCVHCQYECEALVTGIGEGSGRSPYFIDNAGASERAHAGALGNAQANMRYALRGAKCPRCGKHDRRVHAYVYLISALLGLGLGLLVSGLILAAAQGSRFGWGAGVLALVVTTAIVTFARSQRMLSGAMLMSNDLGVPTGRRF